VFAAAKLRLLLSHGVPLMPADLEAWRGKVAQGSRIAELKLFGGVNDEDLRNLPMLSGFTGGPTEWRNGSVYNPADGRTYRGTITMNGDNSLNLRGCVVAPLCKTQTWTRIQ
jgi:uncharacterized protein (DUF2147 family)